VRCWGEPAERRLPSQQGRMAHQARGRLLYDTCPSLPEMNNDEYHWVPLKALPLVHRQNINVPYSTTFAIRLHTKLQYMCVGDSVHRECGKWRRSFQFFPFFWYHCRVPSLSPGLSEGTTYIKHLEHVVSKWKAIPKTFLNLHISGHNVCALRPWAKSYSQPH